MSRLFLALILLVVVSCSSISINETDSTYYAKTYQINFLSVNDAIYMALERPEMEMPLVADEELNVNNLTDMREKKLYSDLILKYNSDVNVMWYIATSTSTLKSTRKVCLTKKDVQERIKFSVIIFAKEGSTDVYLIPSLSYSLDGEKWIVETQYGGSPEMGYRKDMILKQLLEMEISR